MPTVPEQEAFAYLQGRMVELLLRHDLGKFATTFAERRAALFDDARHALLWPYRELAVLFYLRDELFGSILPRIKRRLSFLAPREIVSEELPPRGRIDWPRTMVASLRERPGEPPLEVQTRQRRRHFATAPNLLTVVTILEYRATVQQRLDNEQATVGNQALRHPLHEIIEQCNRELAFPQFVGLVRQCEQIAEGYAEQTSVELEQAVEADLLPGRNSAYDDLITWRRQLADLRLLEVEKHGQRTDPDMLGADPQRDNYLYQLWLFYEIANMLSQRGLIEAWPMGAARLRFRWGEGADSRSYWLQHDHGIPHYWQNAPGVRPDLYIVRADRRELRHGAELIWQEPGVVLDAKYYKPRDSVRAPSGPVKRMIADLQLTGERLGSLLFAFQQGEPPVDNDDTDLADALPVTGQAAPLYRVSPSIAATATTRPDAQIGVWQIQPRIEGQAATTALLHALLDEVHGALRTQVPIACHGVFLDGPSAMSKTELWASDGQRLTNPADVLLCPKPHIGPWRVDLVSRERHCCKDPHLCHIFNQPNAQIPLKPPRTIHDLLDEIEQLLAGTPDTTRDDEAITIISERVQALTRYLADFVGVDFEFYYRRLRDLGMEQSLDLLGSVERESLALAEFLKDQLDRIRANDYSASAIHLSSVMELELKRRVFQCPNLVGDAANPKKQTLGLLPYLQRSSDPTGDWARIGAYVARHWHNRPNPDDSSQVIEFTDFLNKAINRIAQLRNIAAHTSPLTRREYTELQNLIFQGGRLGYGALNTILLAWQ